MSVELNQANLQLEKLFQDFNAASQKLEDRYTSLLQETENLRKQLLFKEQQLQRGQRLAALGEMAAAIAHEIRNPLGSIKLFLSLLRQEVLENISAREYVDQIEISMLRLDAVISNILHFSKDKLPTITLINMHALIEDVCQHFSTKHSQLYTVDCELTANPFIYGNDAAIRQILNNLLNNAAQANPQGCTILIESSNQANNFILNITNSGVAICNELIEQVFEPFVSKQASGTGLGLAIVKRLIEQHHGQVIARNTAAGPQFHIVLPRNFNIDSTEKKVLTVEQVGDSNDTTS